MIAQFNRFELQMTKRQAQSAAHQGECDRDVMQLLALPEIKRQLKKISNEDLSAELREYGAWDTEELRNRTANEGRIVWMAAWDIVENR